MNKFIYISLTVLMAGSLMACDDLFDDDQYDFGGIVLGTESQGTLLAGDSTLMEVPALQAGDLYIKHNIVLDGDTVMNYCLAYDTVKYHSRWVAFRFDESNRKKTTGRNNSFMDDPELPSRHFIGSSSFYSDGYNYDRGHLCASNDRLVSTAANIQTFYMTNMSPQLPNFNQEYWVNYETFVQDLGRDDTFSDTLYVVKGGTIADNQIKEYVNRSNGKKVAVPEYYYMALVKCKNNAYEGIAFWMEHRYYDTEAENSKTKAEKLKHAVTIDELEKLTGIDFFANLPDAIETVVESSTNPANWNLQ
ncbi:MAG: DNA/RNA non-specific endonuclease [Bacteroidales bacterium]|nr:DNA/RNA non-specific endonuclease [Bacteroidales bacterium]